MRHVDQTFVFSIYSKAMLAILTLCDLDAAYGISILHIHPPFFPAALGRGSIISSAAQIKYLLYIIILKFIMVKQSQ